MLEGAIHRIYPNVKCLFIQGRIYANEKRNPMEARIYNKKRNLMQGRINSKDKCDPIKVAFARIIKVYSLIWLKSFKL